MSHNNQQQQQKKQICEPNNHDNKKNPQTATQNEIHIFASILFVTTI